jgi:hypothetical protein
VVQYESEGSLVESLNWKLSKTFVLAEATVAADGDDAPYTPQSIEALTEYWMVVSIFVTRFTSAEPLQEYFWKVCTLASHTQPVAVKVSKIPNSLSSTF